MSVSGGMAGLRLSASLVVAARTAAAAAAASASDACEYRVLLMQRNRNSSAFAAAHVFPGGTVAPGDSNPAWHDIFDMPSPRATANAPEMDAQLDFTLRVTALREAFEEAGVLLLPLKQGVTPKDVQPWRERVYKDNTVFIDMVRQLTAPRREQLGLLRPVARFITPVVEKHRFDTPFYLTTVPSMPANLLEDGSEMTSMTWLSPQEALAALDAGKLYLWPPQWYLFKWMSQYRTLKELEDAAARRSDVGLFPYLAHLVNHTDASGKRVNSSLLPGDAEHPIYPGKSPQDRHRVTVTGMIKGQGFLSPGIRFGLEETASSPHRCLI